jgi:hypothetical protein
MRAGRLLTLAYLTTLVALGLGLAGLEGVPVAAAGQYHVYSCRTPWGEVAPADGWSGSAGPTYTDSATDTCATGGALTAALGDATVHEGNVDQGTWMFSTPEFDTMVGATLWRAEDAYGGSGSDSMYETWLAGPSESGEFGECAYLDGCPTGVGDPAQPLSAANRVVVPAANLGAHLYVSAACAAAFSERECPRGVGDANGNAAAEYLYAADIVLEQTAGPTADNVSGELAGAATVQGTSDVIFSASDPGAGIWETTFSIDGKIVQSTVPDENGGHCRNVGQTSDGLPAFLYVQPCPSSESVDVPFNTTAVPNGEHHLIVSVLDPAGNSAFVLDREINVQNPTPAAPAPAAAKPVAKRTLPRARLTLRVTPRSVGANRRVYFSGRLLGGSIPKSGKLLVVEGRRSRHGPWLQFDVIRTGAKGRFHAGYRFTFLGPGHYELRALCEGQAGYPFATGWSKAVRARVL